MSQSSNYLGFSFLNITTIQWSPQSPDLNQIDLYTLVGKISLQQYHQAFKLAHNMTNGNLIYTVTGLCGTNGKKGAEWMFPKVLEGKKVSNTVFVSGTQ